MLRLSVLRKSLRDQKWQVLGFGLALAVMAILDVFIWPAYRDPLQNFELPPALQAFLGELSIATSAGFLSAEYFSWIPILLIVYAVIQGTGAIAGEESSGTIDLLLAQPVSRRLMVIEKTVAVCFGSAVIVAMGCVGFAIAMPFVDMDTSLADVTIASANMLPITLLFFAISLWLGAVAPSRGLASGVVIGLATAFYFMNLVANAVRSLDGLKYATPFYYYGAGLSLVEGVVWWHIGALLGIALLFVAAALRSFESRDITTGGATDVGFGGVLRRIVARGSGA
ncbi:MAG: ABC transporter permease subunit [Chloroflexi bacterium]|nr:ABC transporter permease subunit [Chloroflexota bacterium]